MDLRALPGLAYRDSETRWPLGRLGPRGTWILGVLGPLGHLGQIALLPTLLGMGVSSLLGIYLIEHAPIYLQRKNCLVSPGKSKRSPTVAYFGIKHAPIYSAGQISSAPWYNANVPQPLGIYLVERAPIYPRCQVAWFLRKKWTFSYRRVYFCSNMRQVIQLPRYPPLPGKTRTFPSRWEFNWSNMRRLIRRARLLGLAGKK